MEPNREIKIEIGSNTISAPQFHNGIFVTIWVNGWSFCNLNNEDGWLSLSLDLMDSKGNRLIKIDKGELVVAIGSWDYEYEGNKLMIRHEQRKIAIDIQLSNYELVVSKGAFLHANQDGYIIENNESLMMIEGKQVGKVANNTASNTIGGFGLLHRKVKSYIPLQAGFAFFNAF